MKAHKYWSVGALVTMLRSLRHGHIQRILDPGAVNGDFSPIPEPQLHTSSVHVEMAGSCIVLHNRILQILLLAYGL